MAERLFGMETEYGLAVCGHESRRFLRTADWSARFIALAGECFPHLPSADGGGLFLQNGARFYMDCGHPEMTTPECANPWDAVRYMHAGERVLATVAAEMKRRDPGISDVYVFKTNVDHAASGNTWGCHTSFLHRADPAILPRHIIPHLVSRIIYTGSGGPVLNHGAIGFTLSPRVAYLAREISGSSTSDRGIFHTKEESLCGHGYRRLHIICGESLCSERALWLNMGATALIVAMIEHGVGPGASVQLTDPLADMRAFAADPTCCCKVATLAGEWVSAVQIQRRYLEQAEAQMDDDFMPPWAEQICLAWRALLERLEKGAPMSVAFTLDWAIKLLLFSDRARRRGIDWQPFPTMAPAAHQENGTGAPANSPELGEFHQELCEMNTRFGHLGGNGIFAALERAGTLDQHVAGVDNIDHALAEPPAVGRARLRGHGVHRLAGQGTRYSCGWAGIWDRQEGLFLDLSNPFSHAEEWRPFARATHDFSGTARDRLRSRMGQVLAFHDRGNYEAGARLLAELAVLEGSFDARERYEYLRLVAWIQCRRGNLDSIQALDRQVRSEPLSFSLINDYVCAYRYQGLRPPPAIYRWIEQGQERLTDSLRAEPGTAVAFLCHHGYTLLRHGQPQEALARLEEACDARRWHLAHPQNLCRALAELGDTHRVLGNRSHAVRALDEAHSLQLAHDFAGDIADFTLTYRAKLETDRDATRDLLQQAATIQSGLQNKMGLARTLLLQARLRHETTPELKARILALAAEVPALRQCQLLGKLMAHWDKWIGGAPDPDGSSDDYWWL